jgi:hypothetical protein
LSFQAGLHVLEPGFVMMSVRISVLVVLGDGLELFIAQGAVEGLQGA